MRKLCNYFGMFSVLFTMKSLYLICSGHQGSDIFSLILGDVIKEGIARLTNENIDRFNDQIGLEHIHMLSQLH